MSNLCSCWRPLKDKGWSEGYKRQGRSAPSPLTSFDDTHRPIYHPPTHPPFFLKKIVTRKKQYKVLNPEISGYFDIKQQYDIIIWTHPFFKKKNSK